MSEGATSAPSLVGKLSLPLYQQPHSNVIPFWISFDFLGLISLGKVLATCAHIVSIFLFVISTLGSETPSQQRRVATGDCVTLRTSEPVNN
jgi:hypothetical protein